MGGGELGPESIHEEGGGDLAAAPALTIEGGGDFPDDEPNFNRDGQQATPVAGERGPERPHGDRPDRGGDRGRGGRPGGGGGRGRGRGPGGGRGRGGPRH